MKKQVKNTIISSSEGVETEFLIFRVAESFGFEKPVKKYIADLIKFEFITETNGILRWCK